MVLSFSYRKPVGTVSFLKRNMSRGVHLSSDFSPLSNQPIPSLLVTFDFPFKVFQVRLTSVATWIAARNEFLIATPKESPAFTTM